MFEKFLHAPILKGDRITLSVVNEGDKIPYFNLAVDKKDNELWGYDYAEDILGNPTPDDFYNLLETLKNNREELSFAIKNNDEFLGEVVVHDFKEDDFEIGFRILPNFRKQGYVFEAVLVLLGFIKTEVKPLKVRAKCYHKNIASKNLLIKLGFNLTAKDDTYFRFELVF